MARQIGEKHGIPVGLDLAALTADGKGEETPITHKFDGVMLKSGLRQFLNPHGLAYAVEDERLLITTKTAAETMISTRVYPVADLVGMPNDAALTNPDFRPVFRHG